jgi:hypothetical protein
MNILNKLKIFFSYLKKIFSKNLNLFKKKSKFIIIFLGIIIFIFVLFSNLDRNIYNSKKIYKWENFLSDLKYNKNFINYELENINEEEIENEKRFIGLKTMFLGIIICVIFFINKKSITVSISLGTFIGSCLGIWIFILFPSLVYFLELTIINTKQLLI